MSEDTENDNMTTEIDSKYRLVILAAKRSKQLQKGARARVLPGGRKFTKIAMDEVRRGLIRYEALTKKPGQVD